MSELEMVDSCEPGLGVEKLSEWFIVSKQTCRGIGESVEAGGL